MKKTISLAMAAALAISGAVTTVPVFADDVTNITIWVLLTEKQLKHGGKIRLQSGIKIIQKSR